MLPGVVKKLCKGLKEWIYESTSLRRMPSTQLTSINGSLTCLLFPMTRKFWTSWAWPVIYLLIWVAVTMPGLSEELSENLVNGTSLKMGKGYRKIRVWLNIKDRFFCNQFYFSNYKSNLWYILEVFNILNKNGVIFDIPLSTYFPLHMSVLRGHEAYWLRMWSLDRPPGCTSHLHHWPPISSRWSYQPFSWLS